MRECVPIADFSKLALVEAAEHEIHALPFRYRCNPRICEIAKMSRKMYRPEFATATDMRVLRTRKELCDSLLELLKSRTFDKISVREIVDAAGVGYNTFFRHYPDKEAILDDIAAEEIRQLVSVSVPILDSEDTLSACSAVCSYVAENKKLWKTLLTGGAAGALREEYLRLARDVAEARFHGKDWLPLDVGVILVISGTFELLAWWLSQKYPLPVERVALIYQRVIASPVIDP